MSLTVIIAPTTGDSSNFKTRPERTLGLFVKGISWALFKVSDGIVIAGVFIQEPESRVDMLIVGDGVKKTALENTIKLLESELGKELKYAYFTTQDFQYRLSMFDKLIRDVLDYPHKKVLNRLSFLER